MHVITVKTFSRTGDVLLDNTMFFDELEPHSLRMTRIGCTGPTPMACW